MSATGPGIAANLADCYMTANVVQAAGFWPKVVSAMVTLTYVNPLKSQPANPGRRSDYDHDSLYPRNHPHERHWSRHVIQMQHTAPVKQRGLVLVTSLLMLVVVTLLAVAMFRSFGTDEKIAGNTREKHRALNAAETAEQAAEAWLANGNGVVAVNCTAVLIYPASQICNSTMQTANVDPTVLPWAAGVSYTAPMMVTGSTGAELTSTRRSTTSPFSAPKSVGLNTVSSFS